MIPSSAIFDQSVMQHLLDLDRRFETGILALQRFLDFRQGVFITAVTALAFSAPAASSTSTRRMTHARSSWACAADGYPARQGLPVSTCGHPRQSLPR